MLGYYLTDEGTRGNGDFVVLKMLRIAWIECQSKGKVFLKMETKWTQNQKERFGISRTNNVESEL